MTKINWPTALVLIAAIVAVGVVFTFGRSMGLPEDAHDQIVVALASLGLLVMSATRAIFSRDSDGDGLPDAFDRPTPTDGLAPENETPTNPGGIRK